MNPGNDVTAVITKSLVIPDGWQSIPSGHLIEGDLVYSLSGWKKPTYLGVNAKVLIAIRRRVEV